MLICCEKHHIDLRFAHFQLNSMMQFNISGVHAVSGLKSEFENLIEKAAVAEYKSKLASLNEAKFDAAIIGSEGLSWKSGR